MTATPPTTVRARHVVETSDSARDRLCNALDFLYSHGIDVTIGHGPGGEPTAAIDAATPPDSVHVHVDGCFAADGALLHPATLVCHGVSVPVAVHAALTRFGLATSTP